METMKRERRRDELQDGALPEFPSLPLEIIREILLRLPAKSIGRFRCVSKLFRYLSSDPGFAKIHLDLSLRNDAVRYDCQRLIVSSHNLYAVDIHSIGDRCDELRDLAAVELDYPLKDNPSIFCEMVKRYVSGRFLYGGISEVEHECPFMVDLDSSPLQRNWVDIVGSCNGLVCISPTEGTVFLFNPTTGESKRIPDVPESLCSRSKEDEFLAFGFGFDATSDDYKLVTFVTGDDILNASVYSLRTDSWRQIGDLHYDHGDSFYTSGVLVNGCIHWILNLQEDNQRVVAAFDLASEKFHEMSLPDEAEDCSHRFTDFVVGTVKGRLCVVNSCHEMHDDIWVMNEYGETSSWSRIRISVWYRMMKPLCWTKKEEVLLELDGDMVLYNFENHTYKALVIKGIEMDGGFEADTYIESLISPNSFGRL